jgi:hypothetical protein
VATIANLRLKDTLTKNALCLTAVLRNAGFGVSKSHQDAWKFTLLLIPFSPETRAAQICKTLGRYLTELYAIERLLQI